MWPLPIRRTDALLARRHVYGEDVPADSPSMKSVRVEGGTAIVEFTATVRIDTPIEVEYYRNGGILHTVLRKLVKEG